MIFFQFFLLVNTFLNDFVKRMWSYPHINMSYKSVIIIIKTIKNL